MKAKDSLSSYRAKRDFRKTAEPEGLRAKQSGNRYLIQKHAASHLHYDFRLELDGVLKSWAVPRGPSLDPHDKRLAVEVEDHPVAYGSFEGVIPKGEYGGGTVMLWDEGTWEPIGDARKQLASGSLHFRLKGKRLKGEWTLVRMHGKEKRNNWLLVKKDDASAKAGDNDKLLKTNDTSVTSGRSMEEIAAQRNNVWRSKEVEQKKEIRKPAPPAKKGARLKMPAFIAPELATLSDAMPQGKEWVHEIKFDGYRALAYLQNGKVKIYTRSGKNWTDKFLTIAETLAELPVNNAVFDGEIIAPGEHGKGSFSALQEALKESKGILQYYVFDLLHLNGESLMKLPLLERKKRLRPLIEGFDAENQVLYSEHFLEWDKESFTQVCRLHLEGIISKRADAPYRTGRGKDWLKSRCHQRQEFVIGGFTLPKSGTAGIGALLIGYYEKDELHYAGRVGTGMTHDVSAEVRAQLEKIKQKTSPFASFPVRERREALWVKPTLACEVKFTEWTPDGHLRHPSFQGLREDKPAKDITRDVAMHAPAKKSKPAASGKQQVEGIEITHPDRVIFPKDGITKFQLAEYYASVAGYMLPHVQERPLSMLRCPEGLGDACFFQRHIARGQSAHLYDAPVTIKGRKENYLMIRDVKGLITLVQWGVIELHPWGCLANQPQKPDRIIFDLDPGPGVEWKAMVEGAQEVRNRMQELGLTSFLKTTGGKGLHVVVPIKAEYDWKTLKSFAKAIAESMASDSPKRYTAKLSKSLRNGLIFIDYLRNDHTATAVAPFSVRAREGAGVATPLDWKELTPSLKLSAFTLLTVPERLARLKQDPWHEFLKLRQSINPSHLRALRLAS